MFIKVTYKVATIPIGIKADLEIKNSMIFMPFLDQQRALYQVSFQKVQELPKIRRVLLYDEGSYQVIKSENDVEQRIFIDELKNNLYYALGTYEWKKREIVIQYIEDGEQCLNHIGGAFFHIGWEDIMQREKRLIFHACCVETVNQQGILFSGRSGIGKSTQGNLWCQYENAKIINEDRPILYKDSDTWLAFGSPYAGSSKVHINASVEVKAIVMLQQAEKCSIRKLNIKEAFLKVYAQLTVSNWNADCVNIVCDMAEQLINDVPVYELACTPDKNAIELLKKTLQEV